MSRRFGRFDSVGQPQVSFKSIGLVTASRQPNRAPGQVGALSMVCSNPMDLSVAGPSSQAPLFSGMEIRPMSSRLGPHHPLPLSAGLSLGRFVRSVGRANDRPIMSTPPMTLISMMGRSTVLMRSLLQSKSPLAVLRGRRDVAHRLSGLVNRCLWLSPGWFVFATGCRQKVSSKVTSLFQGSGCILDPTERFKVLPS